MNLLYDDDGNLCDVCFPCDVPMEVSCMKVKKTFYNHVVGEDYDPVIHVSYPDSRADQLSYQPTAKLVDQMFKTGQMLQASKSLYDFPDGKDDGRDVPVDRVQGLELPEVSQAMAENESKLSQHKENIKAMAKKAKQESAAKKEEAAKPDDAKEV